MAIVTALLASLVLWCMGINRIPPFPLGILCVFVLGSLLVFGRHTHTDVLYMDQIARRSRFSQVNPGLKTWGSLLLLALCVVSGSGTGILLTLGLFCLSVLGGGVSFGIYLHLLMLPAAFLFLGILALLFDFSPGTLGLLNLPFFGGWLTVTSAAQETAWGVLCRSLGAVSCLYFLSLSTPMGELLEVLRKAHVPSLVIELMYLIYRYLFLLLETSRSMHFAAESRLGYKTFHRSLRTTGTLYANLLAFSYHRTSACLQAMESRCYEGHPAFLEESKPICFRHLLVGFACLILALCGAVRW